MRFTVTREMMVPKGAIKISDKKSDAVAYLYQTRQGEAAAQVYFGKQAKPVMRGYFIGNKTRTPEQAREQQVAAYFASRQRALAIKEERKAKRLATPRKIEVGSFFYTSWGYDQTNIDWYMVTKLIGKTMLEVVEVGTITTATDGYMQGKSIPSDKPIGQPFKVRANGDGFKVNGRYYASLWDGRPKSWTAYA